MLNALSTPTGRSCPLEANRERIAAPSAEILYHLNTADYCIKRYRWAEGLADWPTVVVIRLSLNDAKN